MRPHHDPTSLRLRILTSCLRANAFIEQAIAQKGRVLVHCNGELLSPAPQPRCVPVPLPPKRSHHPSSPHTGGISLSPAFVVMYVMQHLQLNWEDALHMVQNRRYCISPNGGFLTQIKVRALLKQTKLSS